MNITVAGTGYVGLVSGVCYAEKGHNVTCVDMDEDKVALLNAGKSPIYEAGLEELMIKNRDRLAYSSDYKTSYRRPDIIVIAVGTPDRVDGSVNLSYVFNVAKQIAEAVENDCVVAIKSTVPVGTSDKVEQIIKLNLKHKVKVEVVSNPEFLAQGTAVKDTLNATRIVVGAESKNAGNKMRSVYNVFDIPYVLTDRRSAEMIKYAANNFLALKISFINEIANLCEIVGADIEHIAKGIGMDPRIGESFLRAGIGYGGSCFPKDTKAMHWLSNFNDNEIKTVKAAIEVNEQQKIKLIKKAKKYYGSLNGREIAILGLTFKPGTDDLREAPSLVNIPILLEEGARIRVWDPVGGDNFKKKFSTGIKYCLTIEEAISGAEVCLIFTEWPEVKSFNLPNYTQLMKTPLVIDGRNCYSLPAAKDAGIIYDSIGRQKVGADNLNKKTDRFWELA